MKITNKPLSEITPYPKNAKKHDAKQINNVAESIKKYGFVQPVVIDKDGVMVIGHCRALAAKKLGLTSVPCVCVDDLNPEQVNALRLVDNKSAEDGASWDFDLLAEELPELDLSAFDFDWGIDTEYEDEDYSDEFSLKDGDREPIQNMTFTFSDDEAEIIKEAISEMKKTDKFKDYDNSLNKNGNGNALFLVVEEWLQQRI